MALDFGKLDFSVSFNPTSAFPLDARSYFESLEDAQTAASKAADAGSSDSKYYIGQTIVVVEEEKATLYIIDSDKTLKGVGSAVLGDNKSIEIGEDGSVKLKGFDDASANQQIRKNADGSIEWFTPDNSTVAGLQSTVQQLQTDVTKNKGDISSVQKELTTLKGDESTEGSVKKAAKDAINAWAVETSDDETVNTFKELVDYASEHKSEAGQFAKDIQANKQAIAELKGQIGEGGDVQTQIETALQNYTTTEDLEANYVAKDGNKQLSDENFTEAYKNKLEGLETGAEVNKLEKVKVGTTDLSISPEDKSVTIPIATAELLGVVKSSAAENEVAVASDGKMSVNSLNVNKLAQTEGEFLILDGGDSTNRTSEAV